MRKRIRSGIYQITNEINGKFYVGSSKNIDNRWAAHRRDYAGYGRQSLLYAAIRKYGLENFTFLVLEECEPTKEILLAREQHYIDTLRPFYNLLRQAGSRLGSKASTETLEKLSVNSKRFWASMTQEERAAFSKRLGYHPDEDQRKARSERHKEWWSSMSEEEKASLLVNTHMAIMTKTTYEERVERSKKSGAASWNDRERMMLAMQQREWSQEGRQRITDATQQWFMDNSEYAATQRKAYWDDPVRRDKMLANLAASRRKAWDDPIKREKMLANLRRPKKRG